MFAANPTGSALAALLGLTSRWERLMAAKRKKAGWRGREDYGKWIEDGRQEREDSERCALLARKGGRRGGGKERGWELGTA